MNQEVLTKDIAKAARQSFSELLAQHSDETFYAFALYTDEDCYTVVPAANSLEQYRAKLAEESDLEPEDVSYYKWASAEWAYEAYATGSFQAICKQLREASDVASRSKAAFAAFKANVHQAMIDALKALDDEGVFGRPGSEAVLFITSSDDDEAEAMEDNSARLLNPPEIHEPFLKRHEQ